jgi:hypothetical protein
MNAFELPATRCWTQCPRCHLGLEFSLFLASFNSFATFYGVTTGTIYRLDGTSVHYGLCTRDDALAPAADHECGIQNVIELPSQIFCPHCKQVVEGPPFGELEQLGETHISAVQLPIRAA